ncbi:2-C-methyl-D-erythritol 4-phosphate cytidylyltransferase [Neorickettsia risticii]|uniref:2-C-methyl-D-erythritol 4-phosphate cytidylyltransferase n=1 Tax=Neorickettsia risticii (strain Illinois) TaxID=434131 RepID=C6V449_NEORI|nr:2-C-methyl-D-erythritol 4-phosphate cytidylyltransferase [Neorickettsia risticii]ACT69166.1 2-C-methyl-D-erythritol 4-phosphate cytidylyltransferase [Neorickettsia risticii str. Illinois]
MGKIAGLVVAGGGGSRITNSVLPKQYLEVRGKAILQYTVEALFAHPKIECVQLVVNSKYEVHYLPILRNLSGYVVSLSEAGDTRMDSVFSGLKALECLNPSHVLIHDAARPFTPPKVIDAVIKSLLQGCKGVVPVVPLQDTIIKREPEGIVTDVNRDELRIVQTPQGFDFCEIFAAYRAHFMCPSKKYTDDGSLARAHGIEVEYITGDSGNLKITHPFDLKFADFLLARDC